MVATAQTSATICGKPLGLATAHTSALIGLETQPIAVEVCATRGPSMFQLVGLAHAAVREARVRVASALAGIGVLMDEHAITVNLAPADLRKSGAALDVAMALAVLGALDKLPAKSLDNVLVLGELALDGTLRSVSGVLPQLEGARARGVAFAIVPSGNAREAGLVRGMTVRTADSVAEIVEALRGNRELPRVPPTVYSPGDAVRFGDMSEVRGQSEARRSLEVAAAGGHNLLMVGPPGGGKTLLARLLPSILPPLTYEEAIEATAVHSVAGLIDPDQGMVASRPFRAPHHSVSDAGLVGGGDIPRPGEISLAHHGVLFLDELAEFRRSALESLRQPLEDGLVCISRARARAWFPARPLLTAAVNPCPCGYYGHPHRDCRCSPEARRRYLARLSGPLMDRIDIHVQVPPVEVTALTRGAPGESSSVVRERVLRARAVQAARREAGLTRARNNAELPARELPVIAEPDGKATRTLEKAMSDLSLSARAYVRVLRVARTLADLDGHPRVRERHVVEALQGRMLDREIMP